MSRYFSCIEIPRLIVSMLFAGFFALEHRPDGSPLVSSAPGMDWSHPVISKGNSSSKGFKTCRPNRAPRGSRGRSQALYGAIPARPPFLGNHGDDSLGFAPSPSPDGGTLKKLWTHALDKFRGNSIHLSPVACIDQSSTRARKEMLLKHHHGKFGARVEIPIEGRKIADVSKVRL